MSLCFKFYCLYLHMDLYYNSSLPGPFQDRVSRHLRDVGGSSFCNVSWYLHYMFVSIGSSVPKPTTDHPLQEEDYTLFLSLVMSRVKRSVFVLVKFASNF